MPAAAAWLLLRTAQLPAWAPLLFRLVAMEENSAAKVGPPALGVLSSSLSLVADLLSMAGLFLWLQVPCWFVTQSALPGSRFCSPPLCCWLDFGGLVMSSGFLPAAWTGGPVLRWFLSGRLTPLRALLQDLVSVTLGVRISWHLRLDLGFSFCFPCRTALQCFHDLCLAALLDDQGLALPRPTCTSTPCIALSSPISSVLEPHQACRLGKGTLGSCCFVPGSSSSPNQYPAIHSCRPRLSPLVDHTGSRVSGASMPRRKGQRARFGLMAREGELGGNWKQEPKGGCKSQGRCRGRDPV